MAAKRSLPQTTLSALFALGLLGLSPARAAETVRTGCFSAHVREAIQKNRARRPHYAADHSAGIRSISNQLILSERTTLLFAPKLDRMALPYQEQGIPLLCDEFESMDLAPAYLKSRSPTGPLPESWTTGNPPARFAKEIRRALRTPDHGKPDFEAALVSAEKALRELDEIPSYFCMTRHLIESVARAAKLAPIHAEQAEKLGMASPEKISRTYIELQLMALQLTLTLDGRAVPYQAHGAPIICQDVPPIN